MVDYNLDLDAFFEQAPSWVWPNLDYLVVSGSRGYGLDLPDSDYDLKGVCTPPPDKVLTFYTGFEQFDKKGGNVEGTVFNLIKFCKLAVNANPNILELLFIRPEEQLVVSNRFKRILEFRESFISQKVRHSFRGYAMGQLKRIRAGMEPGKRSGKRAPIIAKYGFDTKHAMHLVRLMRMGREILETGEVNTYRSDRDELLAVRNGEWPIADLITWAEEQDAELAVLKSDLPHSPNRELVDRIMREIIMDSWKQ